MITIRSKDIVILDQLEGRTADEGLIESIKFNGVLNPLKVYEQTFEGPPPLGIPSTFYVIIDGHRRFDAATKLGLEEIPVEVMEKPKDDTEARTIQVILNRNRRDVKPTHVASAIKALKDKGILQKDIAKRFSMSEPEVSMYLTLYRGHEKLKKAVDEEKISLSAIEPLLTKDLTVQEELADAAIRQRTVRGVRALIKTHLMKSDITAPVSQLEEDIDPLEYLALEELKEAQKVIYKIAQTKFKSRTISRQVQQILNQIEEALE